MFTNRDQTMKFSIKEEYINGKRVYIIKKHDDSIFGGYSYLDFMFVLVFMTITTTRAVCVVLPQMYAAIFGLFVAAIFVTYKIRTYEKFICSAIEYESKNKKTSKNLYKIIEYLLFTAYMLIGLSMVIDNLKILLSIDYIYIISKFWLLPIVIPGYCLLALLRYCNLIKRYSFCICAIIIVVLNSLSFPNSSCLQIFSTRNIFIEYLCYCLILWIAALGCLYSCFRNVFTENKTFDMFFTMTNFLNIGIFFILWANDANLILKTLS
ncbi:hypothetical protein COBT_001331 [Conglomerata obtusa]